MGVGGAGGAQGFWSPADLAFSLLSCPPSPKGKDIPPPPFPSGEGGEYYFISPGATAPGTPGIKPPAALTEPAKQVPCEREPAVLC